MTNNHILILIDPRLPYFMRWLAEVKYPGNGVDTICYALEHIKRFEPEWGEYNELVRKTGDMQPQVTLEESE